MYSKCEFWLTQIAFHGHIISAESIVVDLGNVEAVHNWQAPKTIGEIESLLSLDWLDIIEDLWKDSPRSPLHLPN